ncbi:MAG: serine/threonine protein kinase [Deltaproteobacteria bacterium]|nr:serine/threonine protein kinase [Deltaproteobacteria bacterium]
MVMAAERGPLRVVGRYALYNEIAAGGMATVHIGRLLGPVGFARTVAVKRLHPQYAKDPEFVSMFLDEARLAARVQHPNVVATIDVVATDGELFLIMDYVRGESLSKLVRQAAKQGKAVPPRIAASIICGFLHGLHAAHVAKNERGEPIDLVHRDVSPQNVLVGADGIPRVLDFGIAKAHGRIQVTRDGQIKGKLAYMPPEQLSGRELSRACDIYASAVVMWETLTGQRLFKGETEAETLAKILRDPVPPPSAVVPTLPKAYDTVLLKALSRDASKRHATARELAFELEKCGGIASATEVGEWVEDLVGPILSKREDQIAEIESNSASLRVDPDSSSDSDMVGLPSSKAGTILGIGPPSGTQRMVVDPASRRGLGPPTPVTQTFPATPSSGDVPSAQTDESSKLTTGTRFTLPVDRRLPILASVAGLLVLLAIMGFVIAGRTDEPQKGAASAAVSGSGAPSAVASSAGATSAVATPIVASASSAPEAPASAEPKPSADAKASATAAPPPSTVTPPPPPVTTSHAHAGPTFTVKPPPAPAPPPAVKKNCDPPYTIDANGRKKYKLECM